MTRHKFIPKNQLTTFTKAMRKARKHANLKLLDLRELTDYAVCHLSDIERGIITPDEDEASAIRLHLWEMKEIEADLKKLERWGSKPTPAPIIQLPHR